jgi:hypothetical protein
LRSSIFISIPSSRPSKASVAVLARKPISDRIQYEFANLCPVFNLSVKGSVMRKIVFPLLVLVLTCGVTSGQEEPAAVSEHLKCFGPFIGNWQYKGPLKEDIEGIGEKGTKFVAQSSWRWILNGRAVEKNWSYKFEGGAEVAFKALIGWNADDEKIVQGGMSSIGAVTLGSVTHDKAAKSLTSTVKGVNGKGEEFSRKEVITKTGKDTYTWQALERTGGKVEGPSPVYTPKRVKRAKKAAK